MFQDEGIQIDFTWLDTLNANKNEDWAAFYTDQADETKRKVVDALEYLVQTSKLFQDESIQIDFTWLDTLNGKKNEDWAAFYTDQAYETKSERKQKQRYPTNKSLSDHINSSHIIAQNHKDTDNEELGIVQVDQSKTETKEIKK